MRNVKTHGMARAFTGLLLVAGAAPAWSQTHLKLAPFHPATPETSVPVASPAEVAFPPQALEGPIQLAPLQKRGEPAFQPVQSTTPHFTLAPLVPIISGGKPTRTKLSVASMIGEVPEPSTLFQQLQTTPAERIPAEPHGSQRTSLSEYGLFAWHGSAYCWQSPSFCYSPLYFEQPNLERYGQGKGTPYDAIVSPIRFTQQVATLPLAMLVTPPWSKECTLGNHRPGNCAPFQGRATHR